VAQCASVNTFLEIFYLSENLNKASVNSPLWMGVAMLNLYREGKAGIGGRSR